MLFIFINHVECPVSSMSVSLLCSFSHWDRLEQDVKKLKADLQASRQVEQDLRSQIGSLGSAERSIRTELGQLRQENELLQNKWVKLLFTHTSDPFWFRITANWGSNYHASVWNNTVGKKHFSAEKSLDKCSFLIWKWRSLIGADFSISLHFQFQKDDQMKSQNTKQFGNAAWINSIHVKQWWIHTVLVRNTDPATLYLLFDNVLFFYLCVRSLVGSIMLCRQSKRINRQWANWRRGSKQSRRLEPPLRNSSQMKRSGRS